MGDNNDGGDLRAPRFRINRTVNLAPEASVSDGSNASGLAGAGGGVEVSQPKLAVPN